MQVELRVKDQSAHVIQKTQQIGLPLLIFHCHIRAMHYVGLPQIIGIVRPRISGGPVGHSGIFLQKPFSLIIAGKVPNTSLSFPASMIFRTCASCRRVGNKTAGISFLNAISPCAVSGSIARVLPRSQRS